MTQLDILAPALGTVDTSREAAASLSRGAVQRDCSAILTALQWRNLTRPELEELTGIKTQSLCPRLKALEEAGRIVKTSERKRGPSGRFCRVYALGGR